MIPDTKFGWPDIIWWTFCALFISLGLWVPGCSRAQPTATPPVDQSVRFYRVAKTYIEDDGAAQEAWIYEDRETGIQYLGYMSCGTGGRMMFTRLWRANDGK